ncbi:phosphate propanoyltransferase [Sporomusa acidovorans]|uniref:Phosphate propanoyltransferase n=1 Tax=Sporomusa acidovorans (strain ATCC 49682 / DSM 3132 / Mol) TaxID=1123286 RepID=A0ABZ3J9B2_SPOA4|nr:phosphate propanoyltransferase [Sporomusa acidovorans]OZC17511.1 phosphate propanoyltransferase [Sporomusa acidovorans DSM 3132]SDF08013.1 Propanediol utilization protein [Sporomusa acidovorans]
MLISEHELRATWHKTKSKILTLPQGSVITPSARDFLRSQGVQVQYTLEKTDLGQQEPVSTVPVTPGAPKPEHMTHLRGKELILKTHPIIAWRGQLDQFDCDLVETQTLLLKAGETQLAGQLEEIVLLAQKLMSAEVKEEPIEFGSLFGWTAEKIRDMSHHPDKYFGIPHTAMSSRDGWVVARLNRLRSKIREVELYANRAFTAEDGSCGRTDIVKILNRLSSLFYVLICQRCSQNKNLKALAVGISNRHIHLSQEHLGVLFGANYSLQKQKDLSQPGQFAAKEVVTLAGPKGKLEKVRVLGPVRSATQVEVSVTDCFQLGIKAAVRDSGNLEGTSGLTLIGPCGMIELERGAIVAARHIHMHSEQAREWHLTDGQRVSVQVDSERPVVFEKVLVRVSPNFKGELHLDTDEANAALVKPDTRCILVEV